MDLLKNNFSSYIETTMAALLNKINTILKTEKLGYKDQIDLWAFRHRIIDMGKLVKKTNINGLLFTQIVEFAYGECLV